MDISVIIPVYNVEPYVAECIESVMAQKGIGDINVECLIVDDRGTDRSMEVVRETLRDYTGAINFRIITREANGGLSAARNSGIREAKGEYLYFLDSDDYITPDCLSTFWEQVRLHPSVDVVYSQYMTLEEDGTTRQPFLLRDLGIDNYSDKIYRFREVYFKITLSVWNRLIRREWLLNNNLLFTEGLLYEDLDWDIRAYYCIRSYALIPETNFTYFYRLRANSIMTSTDRIQRYKYLSNIFCSAYELLPTWDRSLTIYLILFLFNYRQLLASTNRPQYDKWYTPVLKKFFKSEKSNIIHKLIFAYLNLGRPLCRLIICKALCLLIKPVKG